MAQKLAQLSPQEELRGSTRKFHQCKKDNLLKPHTNNYNNLLEVTKNDQNSGDFWSRLIIEIDSPSLKNIYIGGINYFNGGLLINGEIIFFFTKNSGVKYLMMPELKEALNDISIYSYSSSLELILFKNLEKVNGSLSLVGQGIPSKHAFYDPLWKNNLKTIKDKLIIQDTNLLTLYGFINLISVNEISLMDNKKLKVCHLPK